MDWLMPELFMPGQGQVQKLLVTSKNIIAKAIDTLVGALSDGEDVRPALGPPLADVQLHGAEGVDGEPLVRVDGDTEEAGVGVDQLILVSNHGVPEDTGVTKEGQIGHVLGTVELGRVHLADRLALVGLHLAVHVDCQLLARVERVIADVLILHETLEVAADLLVGVGNPAGLLGVVGLLLLLGADVVLHLQPWGRIRIL